MSKSPTQRVLACLSPTTNPTRLKSSLLHIGISIELAFDDAEIVNKFQQSNVDLVILDHQMQHLDCIAACRNIREIDTLNTPILIIIEPSLLQTLELAYDAGATNFINHPVDWPLLTQKIRYLLRTKTILHSLTQIKVHNEHILHSLPDLILQIDTDGHILDIFGTMHMLNSDVLIKQKNLAAYLDDSAFSECLSATKSSIASNRCQDFYFCADIHNSMSFFWGRAVKLNDQEGLCILQDITYRHNSEHAILKMRYIDHLTSLPNMQSFMDKIDNNIHYEKSLPNRFGIMLIKLNDFTTINSLFGHQKGDIILQWIAETLGTQLQTLAESKNIGKIELARVGGVKFGCLIPSPDSSNENIFLTMKVLHQILNESIPITTYPYQIKTCIGISIYPEDANSAVELISRAQTALTIAKFKGANPFSFFYEKNRINPA